MESIDERVRQVAARQHGIITHAQLRACGVSTSAITKRAQRGALIRVSTGVYDVGPGHRTYQADVMAAVLACGDGAAAARRCAMYLWGLGRWRRPPVEVVSPRRSRARSGAISHHSTRLDPSDIVLFDGIPITTVARTIVDLAGELDEYQLAFVIHHGRYRRLLRLRDLDRLAREHRHQRGAPVLAAALQLHREGSAGTRSDLEDRFRQLVLAAALPIPEVNVHVEVAATSYEVDFVWRNQRIVAFVDGGWHDLPRPRRDDAKVRASLMAAGWEVVIVPDDWFEPAIDRIQRALAGTL